MKIPNNIGQTSATTPLLEHLVKYFGPRLSQTVAMTKLPVAGTLVGAGIGGAHGLLSTPEENGSRILNALYDTALGGAVGTGLGFGSERIPAVVSRFEKGRKNILKYIKELAANRAKSSASPVRDFPVKQAAALALAGDIEKVVAVKLASLLYSE